MTAFSIHLVLYVSIIQLSVPFVSWCLPPSYCFSLNRVLEDGCQLSPLGTLCLTPEQSFCIQDSMSSSFSVYTLVLQMFISY